MDGDLKSVVTAAREKVAAKMEDLRVADAITEIFAVFKRCNKYIDETMPWALAKDESKKERLSTVLYNLVEGICIGAGLLESFMPETTQKILCQLHAEKRSYEQLSSFGLYPSGSKVTEKPEILFARLDVKEVLAKVEEKKAAEAPQEESSAPESNGIDIEAKEEITFDDFTKMQFQVGEDPILRGSKKIQKAAMLPGKSRQPGKADRIWNQGTLYSRRNGWEKGYGTGKPQTGQTGRRYV